MLTDEHEMIRKAYFDASQASGLPPQWIYDFAFNLLAAHSAGAKEPVAIPDGWMLVKRERIEEIRKHAHTEFVNSYLGRSLYDERLSRQNERIGEEALSNVRDVLSCIGLDEEDRIAAHPQPMPQTDEDVKDAESLENKPAMKMRNK